MVFSNVRKTAGGMGPILAPEEGLGPLYREVHVGWTHRADCATSRGYPWMFMQRQP